jgi:hypothetical protein
MLIIKIIITMVMMMMMMMMMMKEVMFLRMRIFPPLLLMGSFIPS